MAEIILFGGTTEGRELGMILNKKGIQTLVCVATDYGKPQFGPCDCLKFHCGRLDELAMETLLCTEKPRLVIDATHPYASAVSRNIQSACDKCGMQYIRVRRAEQYAVSCALFPEMDDMTEWLNKQSGIIFSALGAKEAVALTRVSDYAQRVWLRILPAPDSLASCLSLGYPAKHIICMQGPFSAKLNTAMFRMAGAEILLTKASGKAGGFSEKIKAARQCSMQVAVLSRPSERWSLTLAEMKRKIEGMAI